ncbi:hypothetical protein FUAX_18030 [Fulvitalea axinellae]|uniref:SWIM-type domain-containing protein n=1 Tax=Fulvitalea axinellae TaxID=1182444 RepID=A0AAU9D8Z5_9BACT|nr:hypothetical protein FUAX_18030 [Fulvitalea axinellae]
MTDTINYQYAVASALRKTAEADELLLSEYSELERKTGAPCFFWGKLADPYITARCLITLSKVVQSSFNLSPFQLALLKDPVVTAGNDTIRFEGFSHCAGVYARVDVLPDGHDGEFLDQGTTNVDFNQPMIGALGSVRRKEDVMLAVGQKSVSVETSGAKVVERKVPLPTKWIKGMTTVQLYLADSEERFRLNRLQALQLFRSVPKSKVKTDYFLGMRGTRPVLSPAKMPDGVCVGGVHRLRLVEGLLPLVDEVRVFAHKDMQSTTWQLYFGPVRFNITLSRDAWRGFSGEGAALESLMEDVPETLIRRFDNYSFANQSFNATMTAIQTDVDFAKIDQLTARLSAMGLLGFDLDDNAFYYRRLPFKMERIMSLNPRAKGAEKLLEKGKVTIVSKDPDRVEARVEGSGVRHTIVIKGEKAQCTCAWYAKNQGERGACKHVLAVKKMLNTK